MSHPPAHQKQYCNYQFLNQRPQSSILHFPSSIFENLPFIQSGGALLHPRRRRPVHEIVVEELKLLIDRSFLFFLCTRLCASPLYTSIQTGLSRRRSALKNSIPWYQGTAPVCIVVHHQEGSPDAVGAGRVGGVLDEQVRTLPEWSRPIRLCSFSYWLHPRDPRLPAYAPVCAGHIETAAPAIAARNIFVRVQGTRSGTPPALPRQPHPVSTNPGRREISRRV